MKKLIIANWKMNLLPAEAGKLAVDLVKNELSWAGAEKEVVLCPSFESLALVNEEIKKSAIKLGAQDCFWQDQGAYTGEISAPILKALGCSYVIIGHSERRTNLHETDEDINRKVAAVWRAGLTPIICVGETFDERQGGKKDFVIMNQVAGALKDLAWPFGGRLIIAYEPVWVIGSGQAVDPAEAEHTAKVIRQVLLDTFAEANFNAAAAQVIYGGSVNPENVANFTGSASIDGILVGGASLQAESFAELIKNV